MPRKHRDTPPPTEGLINTRPPVTSNPIGLDGFRPLFADNPHPMWVYDLATLEFVDVNDAAVQLYGYEREEFLAMRITDIRPPMDVGSLIQDVARERPSLQHSGVWRHRLKDGRVIDAQIVSHTIDFAGRGCALVVAEDITERAQAERGLACQHTVSRILAESLSLLEAGPRILRAMCEAFGWQVGAIWTIDASGSALTCRTSWHAGSAPLAAFDAQSRAIRLSSGESLVGKVWENGEPSWLTDMPAHPELSRASFAERAGLHTLFAVPIGEGDRFLGAMEFLNQESLPPAPEMVEMVCGLGRQVGQFLQREQAEERLRHLASLVESSGDAVIDTTPDGIVMTWNEEARRIFGFSAHEMIGRPVWTLASPARADGIAEAIQAAIRDGRRQRFESEWSRKDATTIDVSVTTSPIRGTGGVIVGASSIARDITKRKRAVDAMALLADTGRLLASSLDYSATLRSVAKLIVPRTADWCLVDLMEEGGSVRSVAQVHRDPAKAGWVRELRRKWPVDLRAPHGVGHVLITGTSELHEAVPEEVLQVSAQDERMLELLHRLDVRSAMVVPLTARGLILGAITFVVGGSRRPYDRGDLAVAEELARHAGQAIDNARLYRDSQARAEEVERLNAQLEVRVRERTEELEAANRELEAFSYSVSHDLRAPLRAIDGFSRILLTELGPEAPETARGHLEIVRAGAQQMGRLIDDLLAFARLSRQTMNEQSVDLAALVHRCVEELLAEEPGRDVEVKVLDLPPCTGDPALLMQAFMNLLSNAFKFTRGRPAVIEVGCRGGDPLAYYVRDNGVGFDMRYVDKLFGVFQRLHRPEEYEGTGVGLAIVQRIVHRHGGQIWAASDPDEGTTTFTFTLGGAELDGGQPD